ncbi:MAG TPA: ABC transporter permease [Gemmatimonadaceae bacterium]|nr:ABC transporter permease [Gemmatimonadaceae bacterium]
MDTLLQDIRYALRTLGRNRAFTVSAVLCLGLGIGANTGVFSMVNAVLLRPFGLPDPERIVSIETANPRQGVQGWGISPADYWEWKEQSRTLDDMAAMTSASFALAGGELDAERVGGHRITPNLVTLVGLRPMLGRQPAAGEGMPGTSPVVMLSHSLWERRFESDSAIVGRAVLIDGAPHTVIGVLPRGIRFPGTSELWVPFVPDRDAPRSSRFLWALGRLAPGHGVDGARAELAALAARAAAEHPATNAGWTADVQGLRDDLVGPELKRMLPLMGAAVGFVLLIACANVANLLLARGAMRGRELALRSALGAARRRLVRQMLTESVVVALAAGALGLFISVWWTEGMLSIIPEQLPYWLDISLDGRALAFTALLSIGTGLLFGILPALRASRPDLQSTLKSGSRTETGASNRLGGALVAGEIALAVMLLTAATLMTRSFLAVSAEDAGFETRGMLTMRTFMGGARYDSASARSAYLAEGVRRLEAIPGVRAAAATSAIPTDDGGPISVLEVAGAPAAPPGDELQVTYYTSTSGIFDVLGLPLREGRFISDEENARKLAPVAVVNQSLAEMLWPEGGAIGRRFRLPGVSDTALFTVVGVAADVRYEEIGEETTPSRLQVHIPFTWTSRRGMNWMIRTEGDVAPIVAPTREALAAIDATLPVYEVRTMDEVRHTTTWPHRVFSITFGSFALLALLLAAVGVYGVMSYHVAQRIRAIGVRLALGASPANVLRDVLRHGGTLALVGAAAGVVGALGVGRAMAGVMYGVESVDPLVLVGVPLVLGGIALLACYLPARRATRIDPIQVLRSE